MLDCSRRSIISLCAVLAGCIGPGDELGADAASSEVAKLALVAPSVEYSGTHYDVSFDLRDRSMLVSAQLRIATDGPCLRIPMRVEEPLEIRLDSNDGYDSYTVPIGPETVADGQLTICQPNGNGFLAGSDVVVSVRSIQKISSNTSSDVGYTVKPVGEVTYSYLLSWVEGCDLFGPCDTRPSNFATYRFVVDSDRRTQVLCPGKITEQYIDTNTVGGAPTKRTECVFDYAGGPSYSTFGLIARSAPWEFEQLGTWDGVSATLHYDTVELKDDLLDADVESAFKWLTGKLGPYPYGKELRFIEAETVWQGFEHPGAIVLQRRLGKDGFGYANMLQHVVLHELIHQWAGNQATLETSHDFAWKEAIAEYLSFIYESEKMTQQDALKTPENWKLSAKAASIYPVPPVDKDGDEDEEEELELEDFFRAAYGVGTMGMFRQLEVMYSQPPILDAIKALIGTGRPRTLSVDDVRIELQGQITRFTGKEVDLSGYFDGWVRGSGEHTFIEVRSLEPVQTADAGWAAQLTTTADRGIRRDCTFNVRAKDNLSNVADYLVHYIDGEFLSGSPLPSFMPTDFELDPNSECMIYVENDPQFSSQNFTPAIF